MLIEWNRYKKDFQHLNSRGRPKQSTPTLYNTSKNVELVDGFLNFA